MTSLVDVINHNFLLSMFSLFFVLTTGNDDVGPLNKQRTFLSYRHCRKTLGLSKGKTYLIMGASKDIYTDQQRQL